MPWRVPLKGDKLQILSALHTTWGQWLALHPDTVALDKFGYGSRDGYTSYYDSDQTGIIEETHVDERLAPKTLVAAVSIGDQHKAYSVGDLREHPVVNDTFGGVPLLVVYHAGSATSAIFEREVDGELLEFTALPVDWEDAPLVVDQEGTTWHGLSGMALDGPRAGEELRRMQTHYSFWFAWKDWRPGRSCGSRKHRSWTLSSAFSAVDISSDAITTQASTSCPRPRRPYVVLSPAPLGTEAILRRGKRRYPGSTIPGYLRAISSRRGWRGGGASGRRGRGRGLGGRA